MHSFKRCIRPILSGLLLTISLAASAKADVIENLIFTGTATCVDRVCSTFGSGSITGAYSLDVNTQTIVGPWFFSMPFGLISSTDVGASATLAYNYGYINPSFEVCRQSTRNFAGCAVTGGSSFLEFIQLFFPSDDLQELGPVLGFNVYPDQLAGYPTGSDACIDYSIEGQPRCIPDYIVEGSTSLQGEIPTPEPSSVVLLGIGMLGFLYRRSVHAAFSARLPRHPRSPRS